MTFFRSERSTIWLPIFVFCVLFGSATVLMETGVRGQASSDQPQSPAASIESKSDADYLSGVAKIGAVVGGPGFAVWYAWFMTAKRQPALEASHREQIEKQQAAHSKQVDDLIADFRADIKTFWDTKRQDDDKFRDALRESRCRATPQGFIPGGSP